MGALSTATLGAMSRKVEEDPLLTADEAAALAGIARSTFLMYRRADRQSANPVPEPDPADMLIEGGHARPRWRRSVVQGWVDRRPGRGARSDLRREDG